MVFANGVDEGKRWRMSLEESHDRAGCGAPGGPNGARLSTAGMQIIQQQGHHRCASAIRCCDSQPARVETLTGLQLDGIGIVVQDRRGATVNR